MKHSQLILLSAFLAIGTFSCRGNESPAVPGSSVLSEGSYTNEYFGLTLPIPDGWFVASKDSEQFMREVGVDIATGDDATLKAAFEASKSTSFQLLLLSEFELGAAVEVNPNLNLMAERVSHLPGIKSGKDYLFHTSKTLLQTKLPYQVKKKAYPTQLGNREWYRADFVINQPQLPIEQTFFAAKHDDYVLVVILSANTKEQMVALERIADAIAFK